MDGIRARCVAAIKSVSLDHPRNNLENSFGVIKIFLDAMANNFLANGRLITF